MKRLRNNRSAVEKAFKNPKYWRPHFSEISRDTGVAVSTVFDIFKTLKAKEELPIVLIKRTTKWKKQKVDRSKLGLPEKPIKD